MDLSPVLLFAVVLLLIWLFNSLNVLREYERGVIFRVGRLLPEPKGPGLILVFFPIDRIVRVSLRTITMDVPTQDVITKDNVSVKVNAVVYFRVVDPRRAVVEVENYLYATSQLAQTTLRSVLGEVALDDLLSQREKLNQRLQEILDQHTDPWGIKVSLVEIKGVDLPENMQRAMARQAEAEREKRAKIIHAQGEFEASKMLSEAAAQISVQPVALQLRYLQTLTEIGVEKNTSIIFPLPIDILDYFIKARQGAK
ncbi:MAG TPA: slipin family protein [Terriglobia bacterium]|jgi:regulator of protease activity HflC (stomatin/prohibitin superfamily)|nr:slipin family protein [Terriglobia bacterium]